MVDLNSAHTEASSRELGFAAVVYLAGALVLLWPVLGPGSLLNLDLLITPHADIGGGIWGLGPELPRLVPLELPIGFLAWLSSGLIAKWILVLSPVFAATGAHRLARFAGASVLPAAGAGALFGFGPWMMTRVTVGHLTMIGTAAVLPWVLRPLTDGRAGRRLVVASAGLAMLGFYGGLVGGVVLVAGAIGAAALPTRAVVVRFMVPQLVWLVPGTFVLASAGPLGGGNLFPSGLDEVWDGPALLAGYGFWQDRLQVGGDPGWMEAGLGMLLGIAMWIGLRRVPGPAQRAAWALIAIPVLLVVADGLPGVRGGFGAVTNLGPLAGIREPQRLMLPALLVVSVGAALGVQTVAKRAGPVWSLAILLLPLAVAAVLVAPAVPHVRNRLAPVELPDEWARARALIAAEPGSVLVLPFNRYLDFGLADSRRVLNPALSYFAPWGILSSDLELDGSSSERADPRQPSIVNALEQLTGPDRDAAVLFDLGIDWVLILHEIDYEQYLVLLDDPALEPEIAAGALDLLRVRDGSGLAVGDGGGRVDVTEVLEPLLRVREAGAVTMDRPYQWGWLRGFTPARSGSDGRLVVDGSSQWVWFWPAALVAAIDVGAVLAICLWLTRRSRSR